MSFQNTLHRCLSAKRRLPTKKTVLVALLTLGLAAGGLGCSSGGDDGPPTGLSAGDNALVVVSTIEILNNHATDPDANADATCQTGATCTLRVFDPANPDVRTFDPLGQELSFTWTDLADQGEGFNLTPDWGPGNNPFSINKGEITVVLATIGLHNIEFKVRARDGREATSRLVVRVTTCEDCGT